MNKNISTGIKNFVKLWKLFQKDYENDISEETSQSAYLFFQKYSFSENNIDILRKGILEVQKSERMHFFFWLYHLVNSNIFNMVDKTTNIEKDIMLQNIFVVLEGKLNEIAKMFESNVLQNAIKSFFVEKNLIPDNAEIYITQKPYKSNTLFELTPFEMFNMNEDNLYRYLGEEVESYKLEDHNIVSSNGLDNNVYGFMISIVYDGSEFSSDMSSIEEVFEELGEYCLMYLVTHGSTDTFVNICDFSYDMVDFASLILVASITQNLKDALIYYAPEDIQEIYFIENNNLLIALKSYQKIIGPIEFSNEFKDIIFVNYKDLFIDVFKTFYSRAKWSVITLDDLLLKKSNSILWN